MIIALNAKAGAAIKVYAPFFFLAKLLAKLIMTVLKLQSLSKNKGLKLVAVAWVSAQKLMSAKPKNFMETSAIQVMSALRKTVIS